MTIGTDVPMCKRKATWSALTDGRADTWDTPWSWYSSTTGTSPHR